MADLKISQLTGATTPLAGTEVVPLVQSGITKKVAVSDLTAGLALTPTSINSVRQKVVTAVLPAGATSTLTVSGYGGGKMAQFQITADVGGNGAGSLIVSLAGLLSNSNYYQLVEIGKFSYLSITMNSATKQNGQFTVSIVNALGSAGTVTVLGIGNSDFSISVA